MAKINNVMKDQGIEKQISRIFMIVVIVFNVSLGAIGCITSYFSSISSMEKVLNDTSTVAAELVGANIKQLTGVGRELGLAPEFLNASLAGKQEMLDDKAERYELERAFYLNGSGVDEVTGESYASEDFFTHAIQGEVYVGSPVYDEATQHTISYIGCPVFDGNTVVGVIALQPDGNFYNNIMHLIHLGGNGSAFMVDATGTSVADFDETLPGHENLIEEGKEIRSLRKLGKIVEHMVAQETGIGNNTYMGRVETTAYAPVPNTPGWSIAVCVKRRVFMTSFYVLTCVTVVLVVVFTILGIRVGARTGKKIARRITVSVERLKLLAEGDLHTPTPESEMNDETGMLLDSMRATIENLKNMISEIGECLTALADGNLRIDNDFEYIGDFVEIGESFLHISDSLSNTMQEIHKNAQLVTRGSSDMSKAAQSLADGATNQAMSIEELTSAVEDISEKIKENADRAEAVATIVNEMDADIRNSDTHMREMAGAMEKITVASNEIGNIMKAIEEIATQTNLLSLNAAIEAARAGEAGKGFAVVADEVRSLAEQTANSAKETAVLIRNALNAVDEGTELTKVAADSLQEVVAKAREVSDAIDGFAKASEGQADAAAQITAGVDAITEVVEANSATAQESAASSEELASQADELEELIGKFKY